MINFVLHALKGFRGCFSRNKPWIVFCMAIIGFIGAPEMVGVTSLCRFWGLGENGYDMFINFFRSSAWSLGNVVACWQAFVVSQKKLVTINGRVVLQGDHTWGDENVPYFAVSYLPIFVPRKVSWSLVRDVGWVG